MATPELMGFSEAEAGMIMKGLQALEGEAYDVGAFKVFIRAQMPVQYRAMTLVDGAALGDGAFSSQAMVNHVLEEELLHLGQKARGQANVFGPRTVRALEEEVHERSKFPFPG